jgi:hypothetical protein
MQYHLRLPDPLEEIGVKDLLTECFVEHFQIAVRVWLVLLDEQNLDADFRSPDLQGSRNDLGSVIHPDPHGFASPNNQLPLLAYDSLASQGSIHENSQTLPVVVVDDVEGSETDPVFQSVVLEIPAPGDVRGDRPKLRLQNPRRETFLVLATQV